MIAPWLLLLRGTIIGLLLFLSMHLARQALSGKLAALLMIGTTSWLLHNTPQLIPDDTPWQWGLAALSGGNAVVLWLVSCSWFMDSFRLRAHHILLWSLLVLMGGLRCHLAGDPDFHFLLGLHDGANLLFAGLALVPVIQGWSGDLLTMRRQLRVQLAITASLYAVLRTLAQFWPALATLTEFALLDTLVLLLLCLYAACRLTRLLPLLQPATAPPSPPPTPTDAAEKQLLQRLLDSMLREVWHRQDNLTMGRMAVGLGIPEYRLRQLINQQLGFRNFNQFINHYRIESAKQLLVDPAWQNRSIVDIAFEAGFQSLGPFNRAFKAATQLTPQAYRQSMA
ncbi:helix-turn-helix domain-containing protein [Leeia aquatica]|uniref:Helix-turn-helix transcriptional regulator n=1 Tax=Leeia aquatica TaxID=2725557 RepID=A0A847S248_9NEIS|nr:helix-turn-helix transcriptional regulator [Leeia aquatica]NLR73804.1 helix-turn-helix transcriptional regulator [Leeia aquatica]